MAEISAGRTDRNIIVQPQVGSIGGSGSEFAWRMTAASWREPLLKRERQESESTGVDHMFAAGRLNDYCPILASLVIPANSLSSPAASPVVPEHRSSPRFLCSLAPISHSSTQDGSTVVSKVTRAGHRMISD